MTAEQISTVIAPTAPSAAETPDAVLLLGTPTTSSGELLVDAAARRGLEVRCVSGPEDLSGLQVVPHIGTAAHTLPAAWWIS